MILCPGQGQVLILKIGTSQIEKPGSKGGSKIEKAAEKAVETLVASIPPLEKTVVEFLKGSFDASIESIEDQIKF